MADFAWDRGDSGTKRRSEWAAYLLFLLFAVYGPSLSIFGELRYVELVILALVAAKPLSAAGAIKGREATLVGLFLLAAASHLLSDWLNGVVTEHTTKRAGTYVLQAVMVVGVTWLWAVDKARFGAILLGYCLSYVFILYAGQEYSEGYAAEPLRLGLGVAIAMALSYLPVAYPRLLPLAALALIGLAGVLAVSLARSLAAMVALVGLSALASQAIGRRTPGAWPSSLVGLTLLAVLSVGGTYLAVRAATEMRLFPEELQTRMESQFASPYGLLAAGRPDFFAGLYAVWKAPWIGHGTSVVDPDAEALFVELKLGHHTGDTSPQERVKEVLLWREREAGNPSHSHVVGAWADAGLLSALCWLYVLALCAYVLSRSLMWYDPHAPLFLLVALTTVWDVVFSPGPHRMDIAIRVMVLSYAIDVIKSFDVACAKEAAGSS